MWTPYARRRGPGAAQGMALLAALLLAACAPGRAAPPYPPNSGGDAVASGKAVPGTSPQGPVARGGAEPASSPQDGGAGGGQPERDRVLAAAKQEGKVVVNGPTGGGYREAALEFQKVYPEISVEYLAIEGRDFAPRILTERQADQYLWDLTIGGAGTPAQSLKPAGVLDPLQPAILRPDILDDGRWLGGFNNGFYDVEQQYVYAFVGTLRYTAYVDRDVIPESELSRVEDLINPKWRGKIVMDDPRGFGSGCGNGAHLLMVLDEDFLRKLFSQDIATTRDRRQLVEFVIRGRYPIGIGLQPSTLQDFQREGLGRNLKPLAPETDAGVRITQGSSGISVVNRAPHPNATKLYVNWLLSQEGQTAWVKSIDEHSRRLDVSGGPAETRPDPTRTYRGDVAREDLLHLPNRCIEIGKEVLGQ